MTGVNAYPLCYSLWIFYCALSRYHFIIYRAESSGTWNNSGLKEIM